MDPSDIARWRRTRAIFDDVVDLEEGVRRRHLDEACDGDPGLRRDIESLLFHDRVAHDPIARAVGEAARAVTAPAAALQRGQSLLHYTIADRIGEGGMGVVWKATDRTLGREVAIKVLPPGVGGDPRRLARFEREAKLLASLNHSNIAAIFGLHAADGVRFLAMEYVPGDDLSVRLARGALSVDETVRIARQLAEALEEAHENGVVHRDLKPANVKLTPSGKVKVLDFGLAKAFADDPALDMVGSDSTAPDRSLEQTHEGVILGTAAYMSPEQARGTSVDKRADIWAFGVVLFEMLAGGRPFVGTTVVETLAAVLTAEPDWTRLPAATPTTLVQLVKRCLEKDARQRLRDIGDARIDLQQLGRRAPAGDAPRVAASLRHWRRRGWIGAGAGLIALALAAGWWMARIAPAEVPSALPSIAVLPLVDLTAEQDQEYFADGLTEELLNALARNPLLRVTGRTSTFQFKNKHEDLRAIGRTLNVSALLEGSVRRSGRRVRITVQLVNASDGFQRWSETYDRERDDVALVKDAIARAVGDALRVAPAPGLAGDDVAAPEASAAAYNAYLRGRYFLQLNTRASLDTARTSLSEAVTLAPAYARAWALLSVVHSRLATEGYAPVAEGFERARRAAERALALDANLGDAHWAAAVIRRVYDWDWAGADAASQRALQLEPGNATFILDAARGASAVGRLDEALELARRAAAADPLNVTVHYRLARYAYFAGRLDEAHDVFSRLLELNPEYPGAHADLAMVLMRQSRPDAALTEIDREKMPLWRRLGFALLYHALGRKADADAALALLIDGFQDDAAFQIAQVYAFRGEADRAFAWLERAYVQRDGGLSQLMADPYFSDTIERDPRYAAFLTKMRLPGATTKH